MPRAKISAEVAALNARIEAACGELNLAAVLRLYETICQEALRANRSPREVIAELLESEVEQRTERRVARRLKEASFPRVKTFDQFDFNRAPELPKTLLLELIGGGYIDTAQNIIFAGDPGSGKSHLATALGIAACRQGRRVRFVTAANLVNDLVEAKDSRALSSAVRRYTRFQLLIVDDLGYLPLANHEAELVFQVLAERSEKGSVVFTTNLPFSEYTKVFPDKRLCAAALDRITHNAHIIDTGTKSQRSPATTSRRPPKKGGDTTPSN